MKIFVAQLNTTVGDLQGNTEKIVAAIEEGKRQKIDLILFSELAITSYPPEDFLLLPQFLEAVDQALNKIIQATEGIIAIVGTPRKNPRDFEKPLCNSAAIIQNKKLIGFQDKTLLPTYDVFDERRYFEPAESVKLWTLNDKKVGILICEDIWQHADILKTTSYLCDPIQELTALKPDFVLNLSASPFSPSHFKDRQTVCRQSTMALECPLIYCNQVGANDSLVFDGYSLHFSSKGEIVQIAKGFEEDLLLVDLKKIYTPLNIQFEPNEELYRALTLGLKDYFFKSNFKKTCLGLSGGIDSALVACIAVEALGAENVLGVIMPSRYSSQHSVDDAISLANNLKIPFKQISIEEPFESYLNLLSPHFESHPTDFTEENLQARIRGMILMALSNKFGSIVLSTGNKSELAMGYSTLYGDMCGGLAVINDITKTQVYALAHWINRNKEIIPWNTIHKPPSAELRPDQKDSDTLPDYTIIDNVIDAYIEEHLPSHQIAEKFHYSQKLVDELIQRIHRNEYKRRQSPPGLRVSDKSFSVGRRFPIVQKWV